MFEKFDIEEKGYAIVAGFIALSVIYWLVSDRISVWSQSASAILVITAYLLSNPTYVFLIYSMTIWKRAKGFISSLLIALAFDITSLPHYLPYRGGLPADPSSYFSVELALAKSGIVGMLGVAGPFVIYVVVPILLIIVALEIVGIRVFTKIMKEHVKGG
jgi:hypothetical protein